MQSLALESREHGVRVNAVCPGGVKTELAKVREANGSMLDSSGFMDPQEIADAVLFLATPQSRGMHGQALSLHGGLDYRPPASLQV